MYYIGIDLGGTNIAAGIVNENYEIICKESTPTLANREPELIVKDMGHLCYSLTEKSGISTKEISYAGIAAPGSINAKEGIIEYSNNIPFRNFPISNILKKYFPVEKIYLENDANAAALGEFVGGAAKGTNIAVMITLGTGVGGGIVINKKLFTGFNGYGAEIGHMVIEYNGRPCSCGRKGCFEAYSSATALAKMTREKLIKCSDTLMWEMCANNLDNVNAKIAFSAMKQGDIAGKEIVDKYISYLACGITNLINIFQPDIVLIGGGVCNEKDYLLKPLTEIINSEQYTHNQAVKTQIKIAELGNDAGIIGAAALGRV